MDPLHQLAAYFREREGFEILGDEKSFAIYKNVGNGELYIRDIWVHPDHREKHVAAELADKIADIARDKGCKRLTGSVCTTSHNATASVKVLIAYGMEITAAVSGGILFGKDI